MSAATIAIIGTSSDSAMSLRPLTTYVTFSDSVLGVRDHAAPSAGSRRTTTSRRSPDSSRCCWTSRACCRSCWRSASRAAGTGSGRSGRCGRATGRSRGLAASWAVAAAFGHPRAEDLLADVLDLDRAGLVGQVRERRLHRDQPVEQVLLVVLEADVQDVGLAARGDVARHLEGHRGLAGALGAADEQQLAGAETGADRLVERREAEGHRLVFADLARRDLVVQVDEDIERRAGRHAPVVGLEAPRSLRALPLVSVGHAACVPPAMAVELHPSTGLSARQPPDPMPWMGRRYPGLATRPSRRTRPGASLRARAASSSQNRR